MNLIDESFETTKVDNSNKIAKIILILIFLLILMIIGIYGAIIYIKNNTLKLYLNGNTNEQIKQIMITEEDGTVYFPIRDLATYLGYQTFNGDYTDKSEDASKCYIQNENEVINFALNSNKIDKINISNNTHDYFDILKPVKAINGKLYISTDSFEQAFNISFSYDVQNKEIYIYTVPFLIKTYSSRVLNYGYEAISDNYINNKTVLNNMLVVTKDDNKIYAVIDVKGNTIIEPKYDYIEYLPNSGDFLVKSNNKVGIISAEKETKIQLIYDSLELIDKESGIYVAKKDDKYGVIDSNGNIKIHIEYDEIGIDNTKFDKNGIKNKYLLDNGMIPVKKEQYWGAFDKNGKQLLNFEYDSFGYIASTNKNAINLLLIPDYNVMVACKEKKYTLINSSGEEICKPIIDDVYISIESGQKFYYMNVNNKIHNVIKDFLEEIEIKPVEDEKTTNKNTINENNIVVEENVLTVEPNNQVTD